MSLTKITPQSEVVLQITSPDSIPQKGAELQFLGFFKTKEDAETARDCIGTATLIEAWGRRLFLEIKSGRVAFANKVRQAEIMLEFLK